MNSMTPAIREMAVRLIALERQHDSAVVTSSGNAARVCEKLRVPLAKLAGKTGYHSLITRAVAVAKAEVPAVGPVEVSLDGSLEGLEEIGENDAAAVLMHLLHLLVTFIGESLTLALLCDAWPDASLEKTNLSSEEQS